MRRLLLIVGLLALAMGLLWIGQGTGVVAWPKESFMINQLAVGRIRRGAGGARADPDLAKQALRIPLGELHRQ